MQSDPTATNRQVVIIGAGPAGLAAAYALARGGRPPVVLEKTPAVGGLARTEEYKGFHFDMGGHRFFTKEVEVEKMWREVLGPEFLRRPRLSRIYYRKKFFDYPLKPLNALLGLGPLEGVRIVASYIRWQIFPHAPEDTFEQWVTNRFGRRLFLTFFKAYTEKVWGIPCSELKAEWAAQRIKDLSLRTALLNMFFKPRHTIKTLIEEFDYPRLGPGMMWRAVRNTVEESGGAVRTGAEVVSIRREDCRVRSVVVRRNGGFEEIPGEDFLSSMPLADLVERLHPPAPPEVRAAAAQLGYRDFLTVCLVVDRSVLFPDNWIYIQDPEVRVGRIQNFKNWSPDMVPDATKTSLGLEYFCNEGDALWTLPDADLVELGKRELDTIGLARGADVIDGCVFRVPKAYPVYDSGYAEHLEVVRAFVDGFENLQTIGRNGLHRYNNQDHAMLTGMRAVENVQNGSRHDLWSINADSDYHEEVRAEPEAIEALGEALIQAFPKIDRMALGVAAGTVAGVGLCLATLILVLKGGPVVGPTLSLLGQYFPGYTASASGAALGLLYGFLAGFASGWGFGLIRNATVFFYAAVIQRRAELRLLRRVLEYL